MSDGKYTTEAADARNTRKYAKIRAINPVRLARLPIVLTNWAADAVSRGLLRLDIADGIG